MTNAPKPTAPRKPAKLDATQRTQHEPRPLYQTPFRTDALRKLRKELGK